MKRYRIVRARGRRSYLGLETDSLGEVLDWAAARWPEVEWRMQPASIVLDLIEAESGYAWRVEVEGER